MTTNDELKKILNAMEANPELKNCVLEMIDTSADKQGNLNNGDDAEEAVINVINKTGQVLLQEWAEKKSIQAENEADENSSIRPHEKKNSLAHNSW